jgi:hypothetical protein
MTMSMVTMAPWSSWFRHHLSPEQTINRFGETLLVIGSVDDAQGKKIIVVTHQHLTYII